jgi:hypothetical protein
MRIKNVASKKISKQSCPMYDALPTPEALVGKTATRRKTVNWMKGNENE